MDIAAFILAPANDMYSYVYIAKGDGNVPQWIINL